MLKFYNLPKVIVKADTQSVSKVCCCCHLLSYGAVGQSYVKAAREPLGFAGVNSIGLRRRGFSDGDVKEIEDIYRILYVMNNNISNGVESIKENLDKSNIQAQVLDFIASSDKGIIKGMI